MIFQVFGPIQNPFATLAPGANPLYTSNVGSGEGLTILTNNLLKLVIILGGLYTFWNLIVAGYMFMSASGEAKQIEKAWAKIWQSLIGLLVVAGSFVLAGIFGWLIFKDPTALIQLQLFGPQIMAVFNNLLAIRIGNPFEGIGPLGDVSQYVTTDPWEPAGLFESIISNTVGVLTISAGLWFMLQLFSGAIQWIGSGGEKGAVQNAQKRITNSIIGLAVTVFSYLLIAVVGQIFGINMLSVAVHIFNLAP